MQYNNQQSVATLVYCGVHQLIPGPLEKSVIPMVLMAPPLMQLKSLDVMWHHKPKCHQQRSEISAVCMVLMVDDN
jgi:hypothetical protein